MDGFRLDYILIDCPPALSLLTINALVACNSVLVPLQCEFFALEGLSQLMLTIRDVRRSANPDLRIEGVVLTMHDRRNRLTAQVEADARANMGELVMKTTIPRNVQISEAHGPCLAGADVRSDLQGRRSVSRLGAGNCRTAQNPRSIRGLKNEWQE